MNPIEQMMECYGVEKKERCVEKNSPHWWCHIADCDLCNNYQNTYPPFTAEKQIELIKLLATFGTLEVEYWSGRFVYKLNGIYGLLPEKEGGGDFANVLAEIVRKFEFRLDHQQVKEILQGHKQS